ncbi:hypothetical protein UFOVP635_24 [uncultured Caudovirales phage]|uniref:Uncharacterized protein n=1 Tax=uncultured Caudovirales phage TaxID=2100421 RepID=A0A6J5N8E8_9CAUD|nr:hypothetical protein UFOVP635_24 [uncultured Caudovirales phage]
MINVEVKIQDNITKDLKNIRKQLDAIPKKAAIKYRELTPINSGNARRNTFLFGKDVIRANYPYAERLDKGWSSQAPKGMTSEITKWLDSEVKSILG